MKPQLGSAVALLLTVVTGFAAVTFGSESGMFRDGSPQHRSDEQMDTLAAPTIAPKPTPRVIEQVVYRDEYVEVAAPVPVADSQVEPAQLATEQLTATGNGAVPGSDGPTGSDDHEGRGEDEDEHDHDDDD